MKKILVLDWSAICKASAMGVNSRKVPWTNASFDEELSARICEFTYSLWRQHSPDVTVIAQDAGPYWRKQYIHDWYLANAQFYKHSSDTYVLMDGDLRRCEFEWDEAGTKRVELHKITAKLKAELLLGTEAKGKKEAQAPLAKPIDKPEWADELLPIKEYKGNRSSKRKELDGLSWETYYNLEESLARHIAPLIGGVAIKIKGLEADDIATAIIGEYGNKFGFEVQLASIDGDWHQHVAHAKNAKFHYLYDNTHHSHTSEQVEAMTQMLRVKIVGGEPGDFIGGCPRLDHKGWSCVGKDSAPAIIEDKAYHLLEPAYLERNTRMIKMIPEYLPEWAVPAVREALAKKQTLPDAKDLTYTWTDLGLGIRARERIDLSADASRVWAQYNPPNAFVKAMGSGDAE